MLTKRQEEKLHSFLAMLEEDTRPFYREVLACLTDLGYRPVSGRGNLSFQHSLHNKQIAKLGMGKDRVPLFSLRFSACRAYSEKMAAAVAAYQEKYPKRTALCVTGGCGCCKGEPDTHVYRGASSGGAGEAHCGAYAIELRGITADDAEEIKSLIREEHAYLMEHEAGLSGRRGVGI